jgi:hypothetical protein
MSLNLLSAAMVGLESRRFAEDLECKERGRHLQENRVAHLDD